MATVKIWSVKNNLSRVIDYAEDSNKTELAMKEDLKNILGYVENDSKTKNKQYVTTINCSKENALEEMIEIKKKYRKTEGILAFHGEQSFPKGEVTPEEAHKIGVELANEMWGDRFQVIVTTHLNTNHFHNHFVINSVSFIDGKRYYDTHSTYADLRNLSNIICEEHGLSFLEEKTTKKGINYKFFQKKDKVYKNYYTTAKEDIDFAIALSNNYQEFLKILKNSGYNYTFRAGKMSIRGENYKRNIRVERYFGEDYSIENIEKQIKNSHLSTTQTHFKKDSMFKNHLNNIKQNKNSLWVKYMRYCNLLNNYPQYIKNTYISQTIREEAWQLDEISAEAVFLTSNNIETDKDFSIFFKKKNEEFISLIKESKMCNKTDMEFIDIQKNIASKRRELEICTKIKKRSTFIDKNLKILEAKEMIENEHVK